MSIRSVSTIAALFLIAALLLAALAQSNHVAFAVPQTLGDATASATPTPTPPPPPTDGPTPTYRQAPTDPSLADYIDTPDEAIAKAYEYDRRLGLVWDVPWDTTTPRSDPSRFIILRFSDLTAEGAAAGEPVTYVPDLIDNAGAVWSVTILGQFSPPEEPSSVTSGATYVVSERSGILWVERIGLVVIPPVAAGTPVPSFIETPRPYP